MELLFKKQHLKKVLRGEKTQTRRRIGRSTLKIGSKYSIRNGWFKKAEHHILITRRFQQQLGDISLEDVHKEGFKTLNEFKVVWTKINGDWNPNEVVTVYEFKLINRRHS